MSNLALDIWKLPYELNKETIVDTGITYNLDSDFSLFMGTKPSVISIVGEEENITNK